MAEALAGLRVLETAEGLAGPFAGKLLADLGADVVKIERPPAGDPIRGAGPFPDDAPGAEGGATFFAVNTGKRSLALDWRSGEGRALLLDLAAAADVVIADGPEPALAEAGVGYAALRARRTDVILLTVSGFGSDGPYAGYQWSHLLGCALGGWSYLCGEPGREPLQAGGNLTDMISGGYGAVAVLLAVEGRDRHGQGEHIDLSGWEAMITASLLQPQRVAYGGDPGVRSGGVNTGPSFILPARDGYVGANVLTQPQWELLCTFLGRADLAEAPEFQSPAARLQQGAELAGMFSETVADRSAEAVFHEAQEWRIPFGLVPTLPQIFEMQPHRERNFWAAVDHPGAGQVRLPGVPFQFDGERHALRRPPRLGEDTAAVLREMAGVTSERLAALRAAGVVGGTPDGGGSP